MRDPGFLACDLIAPSDFFGARLEIGQIGAIRGFGQYCSRQDFAAGDFRQPMLFLRFGAAAQNQFGRDFGPRPDRAHADVAAAELFGDQHHRKFAQAGAAVIFRNRQAKDAQLGHGVNHRHGNEHIFEMDVVGDGQHFLVDKLAKLVADHDQGVVVDTRIAEVPDIMNAVGDLGQERRRRRRADVGARFAGQQGRQIVAGNPQFFGQYFFGGAKIDGPCKLARRQADKGMGLRRFQGACLAFLGHPPAVVDHFANAFAVDGQHTEGMRFFLQLVEQVAGNFPVFTGALGNIGFGDLEQTLDTGERLLGQLEAKSSSVQRRLTDGNVGIEIENGHGALSLKN